jgi:exodeoxyribonuclease V alpha subunit
LRNKALMAILTGHIERITFSDDETGYSVCKLKVKDNNNPVTIVGNLINPVQGEFIEVEGEWTIHPKFGSQLQISQYRSLTPATRQGIQKYLGSGLIKGIGPVMAKRIVAHFGTDSLDIIEKEPERLTEVEGIAKKRIEMIKEAWDDQKEVRSVMLFLQSHNVSAAYAARIFKTYGQESISIVQENPYRLAHDIFGIGFKTADQIAEKLGMEKDNPRRIEAGIEFLLNELASEGHVCFPKSQLSQKAISLLDVRDNLISKSLLKCQSDNRIVVESLNLQSQITNHKLPEEMVFSKKLHVCETGIASSIIRLINAHRSLRSINTDKALEWVKKEIFFTLSPAQEEAVRQSLTEKILIITGGPGTGKTTIINAVIKILKAAGAKILLAAPTGRAAKRMNEATWERASTIHRMLDYSLKLPGFKKNSQNPLKCDALIIDEASMIDTVLMYHLLKATPSGAILILVGDVNQLPSVGPGNVLNDLIESHALAVVTLDTIFRQASRSLIVVNAHRINSGMFPVIANDNKTGNFFFIQRDEPEDVLKTILELVKDRIPATFGFDPVDEIQVLTPMHKGVIGAGNLNNTLQQVLNPNETVVQRGNREFRVQDKVMQIRNNYDKHTYNGDIGRIRSIDVAEQEVVIDFDGRQVPYDFTSLDEIVHAYAISIHKSQGSEYPAVIVPIVTQHYILLQRNLIYTAITRGKKLLVLVGSKKALAIAIRNVKSMNRYTRLCQRLQKSGTI